MYIANGLAPSDIEYLRKLLRVEREDVTMNYYDIKKDWKDMFIDGPQTGFPVLRLDNFGFDLPAPAGSGPLKITSGGLKYGK